MTIKKKKAPRPHGDGNLCVCHGSWYVRYRVNGVRHKQILGRCSEFPGGKPEVDRAARKVLDGVPMRGDATGRNTTLATFIERGYLPDQKLRRRASTYAEYEGMFTRHIKPLPESQLPLWQYRKAHVQRLLDAIAAKKLMSLMTHKHLKAFLSGVFRYAAELDMLSSNDLAANPVHGARLPSRCLESRETVAHTSEEIRAVLRELEDDPAARAIVAIAAFAGLRRAELAGLRWMDYDGATISIKQTVWGQHVNPPKSKASATWVPVVPPLRDILDAYRAKCEREDQFGSMTPDARMFHYRLDHIGRKRISEAFERAGFRFSGYHAFRRGLASNLFELGADDLTVQRILRHASVQVTRQHYIKLRDGKVDAAMDSLTRAWNGPRPGLDSEAAQSEVVEK